MDHNGRDNARTDEQPGVSLRRNLKQRCMQSHLLGANKEVDALTLIIFLKNRHLQVES